MFHEDICAIKVSPKDAQDHNKWERKCRKAHPATEYDKCLEEEEEEEELHSAVKLEDMHMCKEYSKENKECYQNTKKIKIMYKGIQLWKCKNNKLLWNFINQQKSK